MKINEEINRIKSIMGISESKQTEASGLSILTKAGAENPEEIIAAFSANDLSTNQRNIPLMAFIYSAWNYRDIENIISFVNLYEEMAKNNRIKFGQIEGKSFKIGNNIFNNFITFTEYLDGEKNKYSTKSKDEEKKLVAQFKSEKKPMWSGNGIDIFEGDHVGKCIAYTMGGLTGKSYPFCIGQPGNTMYQSYRDTKTSTFYYIIDRNHFKEDESGNVDLTDPLHIVVFDNTEHGIELTDANNHTGNIADPYGKNSQKYVEYLESMGVPVDRLINKPKTPEEEKEDRLLGNRRIDLDWFKQLSYDYKSKYIGRGHLLTDEQFNYLMGEK